MMWLESLHNKQDTSGDDDADFSSSKSMEQLDLTMGSTAREPAD
jgi:hypothetical protein